MAQLAEEVRSGATEMVGKTYRGASGKIEGRFGGGMTIMYPELIRAGMAPGEAAQAVKRGKGIRFRRLLRATEIELGGHTRKHSRGRLKIVPHSGNKKCKLCRAPHSSGEHRFHGPGSFHQTHAFSFNPPEEDPHQAQLRKFKRFLLDRGYMVDSLPASTLSDLFKVHSKNKKLWADYIRWEQGPSMLPEMGGLFGSNPRMKKRRKVRIVRRRRKLRNPRQATVIYSKVLRIEAQKGQQHICDAACARAGHRYFHDFKTKPMMIGLPNGDILIKG